jgi:prepilin-type processing-associated H-X9-DG protein
MIAEKHNADLRTTGGFGNPTNFHSGFTEAGWVGNIDSVAYLIPNGTRAAAAYPNGPDGAVSARHAGMANFLFCDGHVKTMRPVNTNPDPVHRPQDDLWNATR